MQGRRKREHVVYNIAQPAVLCIFFFFVRVSSIVITTLFIEKTLEIFVCYLFFFCVYGENFYFRTHSRAYWTGAYPLRPRV